MLVDLFRSAPSLALDLLSASGIAVSAADLRVLDSTFPVTSPDYHVDLAVACHSRSPLLAREEGGWGGRVSRERLMRHSAPRRPGGAGGEPLAHARGERARTSPGRLQFWAAVAHGPVHTQTVAR